ncbi:MAG: hypothetical protein SF162_19870 [bacterium]|nr:hypothetical protein [bacterium]
MSALEQEVLAKLMQLDEAARWRVLQVAAQTFSPPAADSWVDEAHALRMEMRVKYGTLSFSAAALVDEVREERLRELAYHHTQ